MAQDYLNPKQENFARFLAEGFNQLDAYTKAGYRPSSANACTLANQRMIKDRVAEIQVAMEVERLEFERITKEASTPELLIKGIEWTFQRVMDMMAKNVELAQIAGEYKAANEGLKMMAESMKMFEKASTKGDDTAKLPKGSTVNLIGQVTNMLEAAREEAEPVVNSLAPRR